MTTAAYLTGLLAPVPDEIDALDLPVSGSLPPELSGRYFRNGPNPLPGQDPGHWFTGHGMIHGIRLRDGRAEWYRNRWVRTPLLAGEGRFITDTGIDRTAVPANTHVVRHADRILALVENGLPYEMTPDLETVGPCDFGGRLTTAMTAHPKEDPLTGDLHFFGYGFAEPYLTYHRLSSAGELVESREIPVPGPTMMHDFAITRGHVIWLDLPVVFDVDFVGRGLPYRWDDGYGARLGVMPREGGPVRWFDVDPCYVFHVGNAHEDEHGRVVVDAVRYSPGAFATLWPRIGGSANPAAETGGAALHRWVLDPATGVAKDERLDDRAVEFPTINDARTGLTGRYVYAVADDAVVKYDTETGASLAHETGERSPGEAVFVPADGGGEDEGWLLSIVGSEHEAELRVLDASDLTAVASVRLPRRVPAGFHGSWIPDE
ncbi:carotenoid oxygenase family protein [Microbispora sp. ATCC PTA-5024]|uniref:carotenoid oxygenase family protein n=1 Tax=Microbispora sp. ATCC PTA-5024 TaxID=316330 RepID=UPI0003DC021A|nr:carotenoid oxygenase family protein [Microbispora sp. ATCC PTA-5024]ETK35082.1 dioxygenase [Microbispora sp. ATCC PTA-5024]